MLKVLDIWKGFWNQTQLRKETYIGKNLISA